MTISVKVSKAGEEVAVARATTGEVALFNLRKATQDFAGQDCLITVHFRGEHLAQGPDFVWTESS